MDDKELSIITAIILAGIVSGEGTTNDERTIKRAIDLAYRMQVMLGERLKKSPVPAV